MKRLIKKVTSSDNTVWTKVHKDSEWNEYVVTSSLGDKYHTGDREDAFETAQAICFTHER